MLKATFSSAHPATYLPARRIHPSRGGLFVAQVAFTDPRFSKFSSQVHYEN
jgi:hypothetical protein